MTSQKLALDVKEAREVLGGISQPTFYKLVANNELRTFTIGRRRYTTPEACAEYIRAREKAAKS